MKIVPIDCSNCLADLVGFDVCEKPAQCLNIIDLDGISEDFLDAIADPSKQAGSYDVIDTAKKNAYYKIKQDLLSAFGTKNGFGFELLQSEEINKIRPDKIFTPLKLRQGQLISFDNSKYQILNVKSIKLFSDAVGTVAINIIDINSNQVLYTITSAVGIGFNKIEIDKQFEVESNNEQVVIEVIPSNTLDGHLYESTCGDSNVGCGCLCTTIQNTDSMSLHYDSITDLKAYYYENANHFFCADYAIECDIDNLICNNKKIIMYAYYLCIYLMIVNMQITSPRINFLSETNIKAIKAMILPMKKKDYYQALNRAVEQMLTMENVKESACFSCMPESSTAGIMFVDRN